MNWADMGRYRPSTVSPRHPCLFRLARSAVVGDIRFERHPDDPGCHALDTCVDRSAREVNELHEEVKLPNCDFLV